MKKFKKILAIVVSLLLVFTAIAPVFAEGTELPEDAKILKDLGIMKGGDAGVNDEYLAATTTRMQTAVMFLRIKGLEQDALAFEGDEMFEDELAEDYWGIPYLKYLKANPDLGWVGGTDGYFNPEDAVTPQQYYKVLLTALGWEQGVDFDWSDVIGFARAQAMFKVAKLDVLTNADFATATVEALKASLSDGSMSLIDSLVALEAITLESAIAVGLIDEQVKIEQQAIAAVEKYEAAETETAAAIEAAAALQKEAEDAVALVADTELAAGLATRIDDKKAAIVEKGAQLDAEKAVAAYEAAPFATDADVTAAGTLEADATAKVALVKDTVANAAFAKRVTTMKAKIVSANVFTVKDVVTNNLKNITITFTKAVDTTTLNNTNVVVKVNGTTVQPASNTVSTDKMAWTLEIGGLNQSDSVVVAIDNVKKDGASDVISGYAITKTIMDTAAPSVISVTVINSKQIEVVFSEPINVNTNGSYKTSDLANIAMDLKVDGSYVFAKVTPNNSANKLIIDFYSSLVNGTHKLELSNGKDFAMIKFATYSKDFDTVADTTPPKAVSVTNTGVNVVKVTFDETIQNPAGVTVTVKETGNATDLAAGAVLSVSGKELTITFAGPTKFSASSILGYVVTYKNVEDVFANKTTTDQTIDGKVADDTTAPTIVSYKLLTNNKIEVTMSESVDFSAATIKVYAAGSSTELNSSAAVAAAAASGTANAYDLTVAYFAGKNATAYDVKIMGVVDNTIRRNALGDKIVNVTTIDDIAPTVTVAYELGTAGNSHRYEIRFSEAMDATKLAAIGNYIIGVVSANVSLSNITGASVTVSSDNKKVTINIPNTDLNGYAVIAAPNLTDVAGKYISNASIGAPVAVTMGGYPTFSAADITVQAISKNTIKITATNHVFTAAPLGAFSFVEKLTPASIVNLGIMGAQISSDGTFVTLTTAVALTTDAKADGTDVDSVIDTLDIVINNTVVDSNGVALTPVVAGVKTVADKITGAQTTTTVGAAPNNNKITIDFDEDVQFAAGWSAGNLPSAIELIAGATTLIPVTDFTANIVGGNIEIIVIKNGVNAAAVTARLTTALPLTDMSGNAVSINSTAASLTGVTEKVVPTVMSATFASATTLVIVFSEAVNAVAGDFTDGKTSAPGTFTVSAIAGSGTNTITLTIAGAPAVATGVTGSVDIAATVTDLAGNAFAGANDQAIASGF